MRIRVAARLGVLLLLVGIAATWSVRAADDPSDGTWKLNVEKSKFDPGPAAKRSPVTVKVEKAMETCAGESTNLDGKNTKMSLTDKLDGNDSPVTGSPMGLTIAIKHPSPASWLRRSRRVAR